MITHTKFYFFLKLFIAFFGFLRISNLTPHSVAVFDPSRNMTIADVTFQPQSMQIAIKWSKTLQYRNKVHIITLPRLKHSPLCPVKALKTAIKAYNPAPNESLFQLPSAGVWQPLIASRIRKVLSKLNVKLGVAPNHYTFHSFWRSGATLAYNAHMPIQSIKHHGSWVSDCGHIYRKTALIVLILLPLLCP